MAPALVTIPNVELCMVGEDWPASTGPLTITLDDLQAAVAAQDDPGIRTPVVKLGHTDPRFNDPRFDGGPAIGRIENMRVDDERMSLVGDLVGVPAGLAEIIPNAYPSRSIEAYAGYTSGTQRNHQFVITAISLLGETIPAIENLADVLSLYGVAASARGEDDSRGQRLEIMMTGIAAAGVQTEDVRRAYYDTLDSAQMWWWIRAMFVDPMELIVDDDEGALYRVTYSVGSNGEVTFGEPQPVVIEYVDAPKSNQKAAGRGSRRRLASFSAREQSRPGAVRSLASRNQGGGTSMALDLQGLRERLGLPNEATEDEVEAALDALQSRVETPEGEGAEGEDAPLPSPTGTPSGTSTAPPATGVPDPGAPATPDSPTGSPATPEGAVLVDAARWREVEQAAQLGRQARDAQIAAERGTFLDSAVREGRISAASRSAWAAHLAAGGDEEKRARNTINSFPKSTAIPVAALGHAGSPDAEHAAPANYDTSWLSAAERARIDTARNGA